MSQILIRTEERWRGTETQEEDKGEEREEKKEEKIRVKGEKSWREERDFHFCLHLAAIMDSVTSLGGSVAATDQRRHIENPVRTLH